jgi:hypothetical protein
MDQSSLPDHNSHKCIGADFGELWEIPPIDPWSETARSPADNTVPAGSTHPDSHRTARLDSGKDYSRGRSCQADFRRRRRCRHVGDGAIAQHRVGDLFFRQPVGIKACPEPVEGYT